VLYGQRDEAVWRLPVDRRYCLLISPDRCDSVIVADEHENPLYDPAGNVIVATNRVLSGATAEQQREAAREQQRYARIMKEAGRAANYLALNTPQQILETKARHAKAREAERRAKLPAPETPPVVLVPPRALPAPAPLSIAAPIVAPPEIEPITDRLAALSERPSSPYHVRVDYSAASGGIAGAEPETLRLDYSRLAAVEEAAEEPSIDYSCMEVAG
jgi:hypothetical protein